MENIKQEELVHVDLRGLFRRLLPCLRRYWALVLALMVLLGLAALEVLPFFAPASTTLCGAALLCGALGLLFTLFTVHLCRWTWLLFRALFRALADKKSKKEVQPA